MINKELNGNAQRIRRRDVVLAEIMKLITHPSAWFAIIASLAANVLVALVASSSVRFGTDSGSQSLAEIPSVLFAPIYLFLILPSYGAGSEYQNGQIRITLWAVPMRGRLAFCKLLALVSVLLPGAFLSVLPGQIILGFYGGATVIEAAGRSCLWGFCYMLMSLLVFGLAMVLRSAVVPLSLLVGIAVFVNAGFISWPEGVRFLPDQVAMSMLDIPSSEVTELPPVLGALILILWVVAALWGFVFALKRDS